MNSPSGELSSSLVCGPSDSNWRAGALFVLVCGQEASDPGNFEEFLVNLLADAHESLISF